MPRFNAQSSAFAPHEKWREAVRDTWRQTLLYIWEKPVETSTKPQPAPHEKNAGRSLSHIASSRA
mgnify:CR=1 FL=1